jgi:hypothetical protein
MAKSWPLLLLLLMKKEKGLPCCRLLNCQCGRVLFVVVVVVVVVVLENVVASEVVRMVGIKVRSVMPRFPAESRGIPSKDPDLDDDERRKFFGTTLSIFWTGRTPGKQTNTLTR